MRRFLVILVCLMMSAMPAQAHFHFTQNPEPPVVLVCITVPGNVVPTIAVGRACWIIFLQK